MGFFESNWAVFKTELKYSLAYKFSMLISVLTGPLYLLTNYLIWSAIYEATQQDIIAGFNFEQMTTYIVITIITGYLIWDNIYDLLAEQVKNGAFSINLLRPISFIRMQFVWKIAHRSLAIFMEFLPVAIILGLIFGFDIYQTQNFVFYLAAVAIAFVLKYLVNLLLGMLAFWATETHGIFFIYRMSLVIFTGAFLPLSFFPPIVQKIFFFLPFQFMSYVPARIFMGDYLLAGVLFTPVEILMYGVVQIFALSIISVIFWKISLKRFHGVGI